MGRAWAYSLWACVWSSHQGLRGSAPTHQVCLPHLSVVLLLVLAQAAAGEMGQEGQEGVESPERSSEGTLLGEGQSQRAGPPARRSPSSKLARGGVFSPCEDPEADSWPCPRDVAACHLESPPGLDSPGQWLSSEEGEACSLGRKEPPSLPESQLESQPL